MIGFVSCFTHDQNFMIVCVSCWLYSLFVSHWCLSSSEPQALQKWTLTSLLWQTGMRDKVRKLHQHFVNMLVRETRKQHYALFHFRQRRDIFTFVRYCQGAGIACWLECQTHQKVVSLNPSMSGGRIFFSRVNFVCWLYLLPVPPPCYRSGTLKTPVTLPKVQVAGYT